MAKSKLVKSNEKIAEGVISGYRKIEDSVVSGYRKIEEGAVGGFNKIADKFVDNFLTKDGETIEEAKVRLAAEQRQQGRNLLMAVMLERLMQKAQQERHSRMGAMD